MRCLPANWSARVNTVVFNKLVGETGILDIFQCLDKVVDCSFVTSTVLNRLTFVAQGIRQIERYDVLIIELRIVERAVSSDDFIKAIGDLSKHLVFLLKLNA